MYLWSTSFQGFSHTRPTEQERERPWKTLVMCLPETGRFTNKQFGGGAGKCEICLYRVSTGQCSHETVYLTWSWTPQIIHKILWQRKRNSLQNIWMLNGCLSAMLSFGTCNGNRAGFTVSAVKINLGILVVVFILKRARFELPFLCCGGQFRKQMLCRATKKCIKRCCSHRPRSNRKREYVAWTVRPIVSYCSIIGKR